MQMGFLSNQAENGFHQGKWERVFHLIGQKTQQDYGLWGLVPNISGLEDC